MKTTVPGLCETLAEGSTETKYNVVKHSTSLFDKVINLELDLHFNLLVLFGQSSFCYVLFCLVLFVITSSTFYHAWN